MRLKEHISNGAALMFSVVFMVGAVFAGADDVLVSFSTNGAEPDRYADGEVVMNGECYALVWSSDGVFEGLNADGTPIDPNDRVVLVAPVAKNGHCPEVTFQIDAAEAKQQKNGQYGVLLLDSVDDMKHICGCAADDFGLPLRKDLDLSCSISA